jgi:hypothetical protein
MSLPPEVIARWKANAAAAGVALTDEDIARISGGGFPERMAAFYRLLDELDANNLPPDHLADRVNGAPADE